MHEHLKCVHASCIARGYMMRYFYDMRKCDVINRRHYSIKERNSINCKLIKITEKNWSFKKLMVTHNLSYIVGQIIGQ